LLAQFAGYKYFRPMLQKELKKQGNFLFQHRGLLPLVILFVGLGVYVITRLEYGSQTNFFSSDSFKYICFIVAMFGQLIRILTVGYTPDNTSGRNTHAQVADEVNMTGIYSTVRHPLYVGNFFMWLGVAGLTGNMWFLVAFVFMYWVYYERIMFAEEKFLAKKFGRLYKNWANRTPAFIPSFKNYEKPKYPFSWKKVIKREKNGINAIFLMFFVFDFIGNSLEAGRLVLISDFWFYAMIISFTIYFILKFIKRKTSILDEAGR
jgi:protein-S-isoprenylcysteine O-methyltransferase Ste14